MSFGDITVEQDSPLVDEYIVATFNAVVSNRSFVTRGDTTTFRAEWTS